jgi:limonene-1,2-epoxide hydrolase
MRRGAVAALVGAAFGAAVAGCGGSSGPATTSADGLPAPELTHDLEIPGRVPRDGSGPVDPASARVIRAWLRALSRSDIDKAASYWALPSKYQNGTPVLTVDTDAERIAVNVSLPCGARATRMGGAGAFTVVTFRLTERPGADCGQGTGGIARGAIRVTARKIREWYRLPDTPGGQQHAPPAPSGPSV